MTEANTRLDDSVSLGELVKEMQNPDLREALMKAMFDLHEYRMNVVQPMRQEILDLHLNLEPCKQERAKIVAWMRRNACSIDNDPAHFIPMDYADRIEAGEHLK